MSSFWKLAGKQPLSLAFTLAIPLIGLASAPIRGATTALRALFGTGYEAVVESGHW